MSDANNGPRKLETGLVIEAVGRDRDGEYKPLAELSYAHPTAVEAVEAAGVELGRSIAHAIRDCVRDVAREIVVRLRPSA